MQINEIEWATMTGCTGSDTAAIPQLYREAMLDDQTALWSFERLAMTAENQGSVVEVTAPLVSVFEDIAISAPRESVRRSARRLLTDLAECHFLPPFGDITDEETSRRKRHVTDVAKAAADSCTRLPPLGPATTAALADYDWLEQERSALLDRHRA